MVGPGLRASRGAHLGDLQGSAGWKVAQPRDDAPNGPWWEAFADPELDRPREPGRGLQPDRAGRGGARARSAGGHAGGAHGALSRRSTQRVCAAHVARVFGGQHRRHGDSKRHQQLQRRARPRWEIDLWGGIRRGIEASERDGAGDRRGSRRGAAVDAGAARAGLPAAARAGRRDRAACATPSPAYERSLQLTQNQYAAGIVGRGDVAQAEAQLASTRAQQHDATIARAQLEHAVAVLIGKPPSDLAIAPQPLTPSFRRFR